MLTMKSKLLVISAIILSFASTLYGQGANPNVVKLNLGGLLFQNLSFQYERAISNKVSLGLGVSFMPERNLPSMLIGKDEVLAKVLMNDFSITPELRWYPYTDDGAPAGFYFAPYARYSRFTATMPFTHVQSGKTFDLTGQYSGIGAGLMLGYQWLIADKFSIDWWIVGVHGGSAVAEFSINSNELNDPSLDKNNLTKSLGNIDVLLIDTPTITYSGSTATIKANASYFGFRPGLTIGYAF